MRLSDSRSEGRFRAELESWLADNEPAADRLSDPPRSTGHIPSWAREWQRALFDAGWLVPRWPAELGGRDAGAVEQMIYLEKLSHRRLPRTTNPQGLDVCAPTLVDIGRGRQRGTGDAVSVALTANAFDHDLEDDLIVVAGDVPLLRAETLARLASEHRRADAAASVLTARVHDPTGYGRIVRDVIEVRGGEVHTVVRHGGPLSDHKGINRQGGGLTAPALTPRIAHRQAAVKGRMGPVAGAEST